jgi:putative addiction module killer protein
MVEARTTEDFDRWLSGLRDNVGKAKVLARIRRLELGNPGDAAPVGKGVSELRIHHGPGYRVYYRQTGIATVLILCGGDKSTQVSDIEKAKELAAE